MWKGLALIAACTATVLAFGSFAQAGGEAVSPSQFKALQNLVKKQQKEINTLTYVVSTCLVVQAVPVTRYGTDAEGFVYQAPDKTQSVTTGLDVSDDGGPAGAYLVGTPPECASAFNGPAARAVSVRGLNRESVGLGRVAPVASPSSLHRALVILGSR
jgi:hypothetical protein